MMATNALAVARVFERGAAGVPRRRRRLRRGAAEPCRRDGRAVRSNGHDDSQGTRHPADNLARRSDLIVEKQSIWLVEVVMDESEASLLERFQGGGDIDAFAQITRLYADMVYGTCVRITGDREAAADATQDTFFTLLNSAGKVTGSLGGWLHRVATRRAIDLVRLDRSRRRREQGYAAQMAFETDRWADVSPLLDEALNEMEEAARDLVIRHFLQEQTTVEIAAAQGVAQSTISRHLEQALAQLRDRLRAKGVLVGAGALGALLSQAVEAAPAAALAELSRMAVVGSATAAVGAGAAALGGLKGAVLALGIASLGGLVWLVLRPDVDLAEPGAQPVEVQTNAPSLAAEVIAAKGFDLLLEKHDPAGAKAIFEACLREYPDYADAYHGLALAQRDMGDPATSLTNHDRAIQLSPERADYYWWQAETYKRLNNHEAAIKVFEQGLEAKNTELCRPGLLQVSLAQSHRTQGDLEKALACNDEAIALSPESKWYYHERGYTYRALGDRERAEADFARGREWPKEPR